MNIGESGKFARIASLVLVLIFVGHSLCLAREDDDKNRPDRLVTMAVEFPGVVVAQEENVSMDVLFYNKGKRDENIAVWVDQIPEGWQARVKTYRFDVTGVHVAAGEDKGLTFEAEPDEGTPPGNYEFRISAKTTDGRFKMSQMVMISVKAAEADKKESKGVKMTTSYPVIRGPSDATFEFSIEVDSKLDEDAVFDLSAQGPTGWDINFKPAYESKYISSLRIKSKQSTTVAVEVKPAMGAEAGEYPFNIRVSSGDAKGEAALMVILTGTYNLEVATANGLLSLEARQGRPANQSFYVRNTGSAANHNIKFASFKPENWKVEFNPESIDVIEPGEFKQVELTITPYEDALIGDYSVGVNIEGEKASKGIEFRTTVKASSAWGFIGIGIIVVVIAGLFGLFRWLGRR